MDHIAHYNREIIEQSVEKARTSGDFGNTISYMKLPLCLGEENKIRPSRAHCPALLVIPKGWLGVTCPKEIVGIGYMG